MIPKRFFDLQAAAWTSCGGFFIMPTAYFLQDCTIPHYLRRIVLIDFLDTYKAAKEYTNFTIKSV